MIMIDSCGTVHCLVYSKRNLGVAMLKMDKIFFQYGQVKMHESFFFFAILAIIWRKQFGRRIGNLLFWIYFVLFFRAQQTQKQPWKLPRWCKSCCYNTRPVLKTGITPNPVWKAAITPCPYYIHDETYHTLTFKCISPIKRPSSFESKNEKLAYQFIWLIINPKNIINKLFKRNDRTRYTIQQLIR